MTPGPGQYSPNLDADKNSPPRWKMGTSRRHDFTNARRSKIEPGPGNYNPIDSLSKQRAAAWGYGTEK